MDRALSIRQPWALMIVLGYKPVENRTWKTKYRGDLLIHAAQKFDNEGYRWIKQNFPHIELPPANGFLNGFQRGGIIGSARLVDCVTEHDSPWFSGPVGLVMADPRPLPFVRCDGRLGLFRFDYIPFG